jgi:hypothetical protein
LRDLAPFDQLYAALDVERNWITKSVACEGGFTHPLKHIVIWGAIGCGWMDLVNTAHAPGHQLGLDLCHPAPTELSEDAVRDILERGRSLTAAAKEADCDVSTMSVWAERLGYQVTRKPKKVSVDMRLAIGSSIRNGKTSAETAAQFNLSITTINRIRRSLS